MKASDRPAENFSDSTPGLDPGIAEAVVNASEIGDVVLDQDARVVLWNAWMARLSGVSVDAALGRTLSQIFPQLLDTRLLVNIDQALGKGMAGMLSPGLHRHPLPLYRSSAERIKGQRLHQMVTVKPVRVTDAPRHCLIQIQDVSASFVREGMLREQASSLNRLMAELGENELRLRTILENIQDGVIVVSPYGVVNSVNPGAEKLFRKGSDRLVGMELVQLIPDIILPSPFTEDEEAETSARPYQSAGESAVLRGGDIPCAISYVLNELWLGGQRMFLCTVEDISVRKQSEERIRRLAHYDALTDLPNRALFQDRLEHALAQTRRDGVLMGVMFLDLDRFKNINDVHGHHIGDLLLQAVSKRLRVCTREMDTVARLGGDEFAIIQSSLKSESGAAVLAEKIEKALSRPFMLDNIEIYTSPSIGITLYQGEAGKTPHEVLKEADVAMYQAKAGGRNTYRFFSARMHADTQHKRHVEKELRRALQQGELRLHYQPLIDLTCNRVTAVEALLRWEHPKRGLLPPSEFIEVAEESGLIVPMGLWVLREACRQNRAWQDAGVPELRVNVNLSAVQFRDPKLIPDICKVLKQTGLEARYLSLEITESLLMAQVEQTTEMLRELDQMGVELAIDDFGTGYSSLSYLKRFPVSKVKIDRSFVRDIHCDPEDAAIVRAVIGLGHSLGRKVVAEGVETEEQLGYLKEQGCDEVQGYFFSRPLAADDCEAFLRNRLQMV